MGQSSRVRAGEVHGVLHHAGLSIIGRQIKFEELSCPSQASATLIKRLSSQLHTLSARTNKMNFLSSDVPDPTDFSSSAPGLRSLDASLRCTICGDLFDAPVTLPCGHCFCSAVRVLILYSNLIFE